MDTICHGVVHQNRMLLIQIHQYFRKTYMMETSVNIKHTQIFL